MNRLSAGAAISRRRPCAAGPAPIRVLYCFFCLLAVSALFTTAMAAVPLRAFVSIAPEKTFVARVGGNRVQVTVMVQPGSEPETYEPTPRQIAALAGSDLYFRIGMPFERSL